MPEQAQTYQQVIDLSFKLNDMSVADVERQLRRSVEDRQEIFRTTYSSFGEMSESYRRERDQATEQYMSEFSRYLKERTDLTSQQIESLEGIERERISKIMDMVEQSNNDLLAIMSGTYREEELARKDAVESMIQADARVKELRRQASGEKEDDEGPGFWARVWDGLNKVVGVLHSMGMPIASLSIEELGRFAVASYEHRIRERKAEYQVAAAGGSLTPSGASFDMAAYTDGIRDLRQRFPSLREQFDSVALSLRKQLPDLGANELIALTDDVRRLSFYTGESMETLAGEIGTLARNLRVPSSEVAGKMLWMTELGRFYARTNNLNIDIGKFRSNIINLADQNKQYGMSVEEAGSMVFRFAKELDKGILSLEDLAALTLGYSRTNPTLRAYMGEEALTWMKDRAGFEDLKGILMKVAQNPVALQELIRGIATKSESVYRRFGIYDMYYKDRDRLAQQMSQAYANGIRLYADKVGGNIHEVMYWWRDMAQRTGILRGDTPIGPAQDLLEYSLEGIDARSPEGIAAEAVSSMDQWRKLVDDNQDLTESHLEQIWEMMRMGGAALMQFTDGMSNTVSSLLQKMSQPINPADLLGPLTGVSPGGIVDQAGDMVRDLGNTAKDVLQGDLSPQKALGETMPYMMRGAAAATNWLAPKVVEGVTDAASEVGEMEEDLGESWDRFWDIFWNVNGTRDEWMHRKDKESEMREQENKSSGISNIGASAGIRMP